MSWWKNMSPQQRKVFIAGAVVTAAIGLFFLIKSRSSSSGSSSTAGTIPGTGLAAGGGQPLAPAPPGPPNPPAPTPEPPGYGTAGYGVISPLSSPQGAQPEWLPQWTPQMTAAVAQDTPAQKKFLTGVAQAVQSGSTTYDTLANFFAANEADKAAGQPYFTSAGLQPGTGA